MKYPGRRIVMGETDARIVKALKVALNRALSLRGADAVALDPANPLFGPKMKQAVLLFQTRNVDGQGQPLKADGEVGAVTWEILFGDNQVPSSTTAADGFLQQVLAMAVAEEGKGIREKPPNTNRGPEVEAYLKRAGVPAGSAWCCAFMYWCFDEAAKAAGRVNPMFKTAHCMNHWNKAPSVGARRIVGKTAVDDPGQLRPGMMFIIDHGGGFGHTGMIERVDGGYITCIEGNTDASRTREGGGVYRLSRKINTINKGFLDYAGL
jgi:hypothetical protein